MTGDKIVTPGAIVQLTFTTRLATPKDYSNLTPNSIEESSKDHPDVDEDEHDVSGATKKSSNDGNASPIPLAHAPYFPLVPTSR